MMMPVRDSGTITFHRVCQPLAPLSLAASSKLRSMRIMLLKIGTIMNMVYRCTKANTTEKSENSSHSTGLIHQAQTHQAVVDQTIAPQAAAPRRSCESRWTSKTVRCTAQTAPVCMPGERTKNAKKYATAKPMHQV